MEEKAVTMVLCPVCKKNQMEDWKECCKVCYAKKKQAEDGRAFAPGTPSANRPEKSIEDFEKEMNMCFKAAQAAMTEACPTIKWTSEDIRATANTIFIQKSKQ